ncbi:hypothetical protein FB451DRAFT_1372236 [Mycena latifolia]|nr:hypothetical protein FB451DRAFT_1374841 [Mycena latifolia]KAJ7458536.1 hypothetical protein FB451DRAFT_1372236 [Mycena latifolia]
MASMSTAVPLTTYHLQHEDRTRLLRSTRKIGEVVGETPYLVDVSSFPPSPTPASSQKLKSKRAKARHTPDLLAPPSLSAAPNARPVLYIRVPDSPSPERAPITPAPSPTLTVALNLRNAGIKEDAARRRKMAKLFRTLGPNVPKDLVFPPPTANELSRLRRLTARTFMTERMPRADPADAPPTPRRRSHIADKPRRHSKADSISHGWVWVGKREDIPEDVRARALPDSGLPSDWVSVSKPVEEPTASQLRAMYRKEEGWSGEWAGAVNNMDDVVHQLRELKVK